MSGDYVRAGSAADSKVDPPGIQCFQGSELLGNDQRGVIGKHDAARTHAQGGGSSGNMANQDGGSGAGDARHVVMLGQPKPGKSPRLSVLREVETIAKSFRNGAVGADGRQIEH